MYWLSKFPKLYSLRIWNRAASVILSNELTFRCQFLPEFTSNWALFSCAVETFIKKKYKRRRRNKDAFWEDFVTVPGTPEWTQSPPKTHLFFFLPEWTQKSSQYASFFLSFFPSLFLYFFMKVATAQLKRAQLQVNSVIIMSLLKNCHYITLKKLVMLLYVHRDDTKPRLNELKLPYRALAS